MTCLSPHQRKALSAAAGVVGRPHLRAGLLLTLAVACGPADPGDAADDDTGPGPADSSSSTSQDPTTGHASTTSSGSGHATTSSADDTGSSTSGASSGELTTSGGTLLTDAGTTGATDGTDTGDLTTSGSGSTGDAGSTGGLDDCVDPRTLEVDWVCCEAQNWEPAPQCTPWGPPAPPAVGRDLLARARAARRGLAA
ncbi:MAG: hypothetical protein JNL82_33495 [Myxococcales bacterium]|nr:hypothetical protein [Myxococcales bacterium]